MNTTDFLSECERRGISISLDGQDLIVQPDTIDSRTVNYLRQYKQKIIQVLKPVWDGGDAESGSCHQCGTITGSMITTPDGFAGWCCIACFDTRVKTACRDCPAGTATSNQSAKKDNAAGVAC